MHMSSLMWLMVASYIVAVVLARALGPSEYGVYGIVYSVLLSVELMGRLGIPQAVSKLVAEQRAAVHALEATSVNLTLIVCLLVFVGFWAAAPLVAVLFQVPNGTALFRVASLDVPFYSLYFTIAHILNGHRRFLIGSLATTIYGLAKVIGVLVLLYWGATIAGALIVNVAASIVVLLFVLRHAGLHVLSLSLEFRAPIVRLAVPVALSQGATQLLFSMDLWMLNAIGADVPPEAKGFYVAATNLAHMPNVLAFVATAVLVPSIARAISQGDRSSAERATRGVLRLLLAGLVPACGLVAVEAKELMALLFSANYSEGASLLAVLIFAHGLFNTVFLTLSAVLLAVNEARRGAVIASAVLPVALIGNYLLIPLLGARGAALAALVATMTAAVAATIVVWRRVGPILEPLVLGKTLLAAAAVCLAAALIPSEGLLTLVELAVLGIAFLGLASLLGLITKADLAPLLPTKLRIRLGLGS